MDLRRIKKLNEEMRRLLEISDEKKQWAVDTRKAQMQAAELSLQKAKQRYNKTAGLQKALQPKTKEEIEDTFDIITNTLRVYNFTEDDLDFDGTNFTLTLTNGDIEDEPDFEKGLQKLLKDMSEKYGLKYTYKINKDNSVTIICEKPVIKESIQDVIEMLDNKLIPDGWSHAYLQAASGIDLIVDLIDSYEKYIDSLGTVYLTIVHDTSVDNYVRFAFWVNLEDKIFDYEPEKYSLDNFIDLKTHPLSGPYDSEIYVTVDYNEDNDTNYFNKEDIKQINIFINDVLTSLKGWKN